MEVNARQKCADEESVRAVRFSPPAHEVSVWTVSVQQFEAAACWEQPVRLIIILYHFIWGGGGVWHSVTSAVTLPLKYAAALFLLLAARPVFVFALRHFLLADLPHKIEEHLRGDEQR